tara:strand:+ start:2640 stop:3224 length:585 start_codon:yes stop_codon:yes gene_type:complete
MALIFNNNLLNELFGREFNKISVLPLDVTISETHSLNQRMTSRPVEGGGTFTDNAIIDPTTLTMSCIVTSSLFGDSWEDKLNTLEQIRTAREPFDVVTSLRTYESMFFSGPITINRTVSNNTILAFDVSLKQMIIISSVTEQVPAKESGKTEGDIQKQAPAQDAGKIQGQADTKTNGGIKSLLVSGSELFGFNL